MGNRLKKYQSKVLLFGEYTVLFGGSALAIPVKNLSGVWQKTIENNEKISEIFYAWGQYLKKNVDFIDTTKLLKDWDEGYRFEMNTPVGYGAGSSGVLTAIVYDQYRKDSNEINITDLKKRLALIESFFHGESSGLDPLVSYLNKPILVKSGQVKVVEDALNIEDWKIYLIDSGEKRSTAALVPEFKRRVADSEDYRKLIEIELMEEVNEILEILTGQGGGDFSKRIKRLSEFQYENMGWLVHENVKTLWQTSLANPDRAIKICGAGGGGYYLMFSREEKIEVNLSIVGPIEMGW